MLGYRMWNMFVFTLLLITSIFVYAGPALPCSKYVCPVNSTCVNVNKNTEAVCVNSTIVICNLSYCSDSGICEVNLLNSTASCVCSGNYTGLKCETFKSCLTSPCNNNGICHNLNNLPVCNYNNFTCNSTLCNNHGSCKLVNNTLNTHTCTCLNGYSGLSCQTPPVINLCKIALVYVLIKV
jgi:hypothetical protein